MVVAAVCCLFCTGWSQTNNVLVLALWLWFRLIYIPKIEEWKRIQMGIFRSAFHWFVIHFWQVGTNEIFSLLLLLFRSNWKNEHRTRNCARFLLPSIRATNRHFTSSASYLACRLSIVICVFANIYSIVACLHAPQCLCIQNNICLANEGNGEWGKWNRFDPLPDNQEFENVQRIDGLINRCKTENK